MVTRILLLHVSVYCKSSHVSLVLRKGSKEMEINVCETEMVGRAIHNLSAVAKQPVTGPVVSIMLQNITKPSAKSALKI